VSIFNAPIDEVRKFVLKHGRELVRDAQRDPTVRRRAEALVKQGHTDAAARVYEDYYVKRIKEALEPWNWF
jgi:hypothetical protein